MRVPLAGRPTRAAVIVVLGWTAAAVVAGFISVTAIGAVSDGIFGSSTTPLSADQIDQQLAARGTSSAPTTPSSTSTSSPSSSAPTSPPPATNPPGGETEPPAAEPPAQGVTKVISTDGGIIVTRCQVASPQIVSVTPNQGFQTDKDPDEGEGRARVEFESEAQDLKVRVEITCSGGVPTWTTEND